MLDIVQKQVHSNRIDFTDKPHKSKIDFELIYYLNEALRTECRNWTENCFQASVATYHSTHPIAHSGLGEV